MQDVKVGRELIDRFNIPIDDIIKMCDELFDAHESAGYKILSS